MAGSAQDGTRRGVRKSRGMRGFRRAADAVSPALREAGAKRGFAEHRILTQWREIAGAALAGLTRPVRISYRGHEPGLGATLVVMAAGAVAHEVSHLAGTIVERVNRVCGHRAVSRLRVVQTAGLELAAPPEPRQPLPSPAAAPSPLVEAVSDDGLRAALARLEQNLRGRVRPATLHQGQAAR